VIEVSDKVRGILKMFWWFPCIVTHGKSLPFDIVLYLTPLASVTCVEDLLHFIFCFSIDKVRWWSGKVGSV